MATQMDVPRYQNGRRVTQIGQLEVRQPLFRPPSGQDSQASPAEGLVAPDLATRVGHGADRNANGKRSVDDTYPERKAPKRLVNRLNLSNIQPARITRPVHHSSLAFVENPGPPSTHYWLSPTLLNLGGTIRVAATKAKPVACIHLRYCSARDAKQIMHWCRRLRHGNIVTANESYITDDACVVVYEEVAVTLG